MHYQMVSFVFISDHLKKTTNSYEIAIITSQKPKCPTTPPTSTTVTPSATKTSAFISKASEKWETVSESSSPTLTAPTSLISFATDWTGKKMSSKKKVIR